MQGSDKDEDPEGVEERNEVSDALTRIFHEIKENPAVRVDETVPERALRVPLAAPQLYDGLSGIALFLAAYHFATEDKEARELALRSASRLRSAVTHLASGSGSQQHLINGTGGLAGLGAVPYALSQLATWLKMPELLESAREAALTITPRQILAEKRLGVMFGCAGTLLGLLSFVEEMSAMGLDSGTAPDLALLCGRHLLEKRISYNSGPRAWPAAGSTPVTGFAHGAAGIAYALVRLFRSTGREEFRDAAIEGFAFERTVYAPELQTNSPPSNDPLNKASWCEGAPGVALGILGSLIVLDSHALRHDLDQALSVTRTLPEGEVDQLCCGNFGRVEIMNTAGSILGRLHLVAHARQLAKTILTRAAISGFRFPPHEHHDDLPGRFEPDVSLFLGLAGIGYTLLRLDYPDLFPSILLLETVT